MEKTEALGLAKKLLAIQKDLKAIRKDEVNPHFKNKYYDINSLIAAIRPILNKHGVVVHQPIRIKEVGGTVVNLLTTVATDAETGETATMEMVLPEMADPQKLGGAITYYRRYALTSFFLLDAEDDDGNAAAQPAKEFVLSASGARKECGACHREFNPRAGWEKVCPTCYKDKRPLTPKAPEEIDDSIPPFEG